MYLSLRGWVLLLLQYNSDTHIRSVVEIVTQSKPNQSVSLNIRDTTLSQDTKFLILLSMNASLVTQISTYPVIIDNICYLGTYYFNKT